MSENGNGVYTKVALLMDRSSDNHEDVMHKLRNIENNLNFLKDEVVDLEKRFRYTVYGLVLAYMLMQGDLMGIIQGLM